MTTPKAQLRSETCIEVVADADAVAVGEGDVRVIEIAASRDATFLFTGLVSE